MYLFTCSSWKSVWTAVGFSVIPWIAISWYQELWLYIHVQAIQEQMKLHSQEPVSFDDIKNEIFDMVKPEDPLKISLQDLIRWYIWKLVWLYSVDYLIYL
jgi:hypothetical protein